MSFNCCFKGKEKREKGADLFKLELKSILNKSVPFCYVQGSPLTVPLPDTRHLDAHMPGGFRYNPGGPGSALPAYPPKKGAE